MKKARETLVAIILFIGVLVILPSFFSEGEFSFSQPSGFYDEPFYLEINAPKGGRVYYTLDGTDPDESSILYTAPIFIEDATERENIYSARDDLGYGYLSNWQDYTVTQKASNVVPDFLVDKCSVVKAIYIDWTGKKSDMIYGSYFVGFDDKYGYQNVNFISVITEPDNFFDPDYGIYVIDTDLAETDQNYTNRGSEWERKAYIQYFNVEQREVLSQMAGIRIHGRFSRSSVPRSLNLYSRYEYDGNPVFAYDLFGTGYYPDAVTLFAGGQDMESMFRDKLVSELVEDTNVATMHYIPCVMFLDGEYWGFYWLTEKFGSGYLEYYYGEEQDKIVLVKDDVVSVGSDIGEYKSVYGNLWADDQDRELCRKLVEDNIDIQSLIDYTIVQSYIGNHDIDHNFAVWKGKENKWKYMLFDLNGFSSISDYEDKTLDVYFNETEIKYIMDEDKYKKLFYESADDIIRNNFAPDLINKKLDEYVELYSEDIMKSNERFFGGRRENEFSDSVEQIRCFFENREEIYRNHMKTIGIQQ